MVAGSRGKEHLALADVVRRARGSAEVHERREVRRVGEARAQRADGEALRLEALELEEAEVVCVQVEELAELHAPLHAGQHADLV